MKRNRFGPDEINAALKTYLMLRGNPGVEEPLFASYRASIVQ